MILDKACKGGIKRLQGNLHGTSLQRDSTQAKIQKLVNVKA